MTRQPERSPSRRSRLARPALRQRSAALAGAALCLVAVPPAGPAGAQVTNDGTLGMNGAGPVANAPNSEGGTDYFLTESDGELVGPNLFHSLGRLDLGSTDAAIYQGAPTIENLITRITGGASAIDGTIRSEIEGARLFLINPDGIVFGENATLDVSGAVVVSTAHEVALGSTGRFDARAMGGDILTVDPPESFGFLAPPAPIRLNGSQIEGADGQSLALVGGDLTLSGMRSDGQPGLLSAPGGRIDLASLRSAGSVRRVEGASADLVLEGVGERGDIALVDDFVVSTSGVATDPLDPGQKPVPGSGPIFVRANDLLVEDSEIRVLTVTSQAAGDISIDLSGDLTVRASAGEPRAVISSGSGLTIPIPEDRTFNGVVFREQDPSIGLVRDFFFCQDGGVCGVTYLSQAPAGDIDIAARDVSLVGGGQIVSRGEFQADAGRVGIDLGGDLAIRGVAADGNRSGVFSNAVGSGDPGAISLRMDRGLLRMDDFGVIVIENSPGSAATASPAQIEIQAAGLEMSGNARIDSSTRGAGPGGDISLRIAGRARLSGASGGGEFTGITSLSQPGSTGRAGTIDLAAGSLEIVDGAQISARPVGTGALGDAGSIRLDVDGDLVMHRGTVSTESAAAAGGNIQIAVGGVADLLDSSVTTSVTQGAAPGGNVDFTANTAMVLQGSQIVARADLGAGGNIRIATGALVRDPDSVVSASSNFGVDGTEVIESPEGTINVQQPELPVAPVDAAALLREPCATRSPRSASSFVVESDPGPEGPVRELLPAFLSDTDTLLGEGPPEASDRTRARRSSSCEAHGWDGRSS